MQPASSPATEARAKAADLGDADFGKA